MSPLEKKPKNWNFKDEMANCLTHAVGILVGMVLVPLLVSKATLLNDFAVVSATLIYGFSFLFVFSASTTYHAVKSERLKKLFKQVDHISIYFLIAGSYTPFVLIYMKTTHGFTILGILWGLTLLGILFKVLFVYRFKIVSTLVYLAMGWLLMVKPSEFFGAVKTEIITLIAIGGGLYTIGVVFYLLKKIPYNHAIWHLFVLSAAITQAIALYQSLAISV